MWLLIDTSCQTAWSRHRHLPSIIRTTFTGRGSVCSPSFRYQILPPAKNKIKKSKFQLVGLLLFLYSVSLFFLFFKSLMSLDGEEEK